MLPDALELFRLSFGDAAAAAGLVDREGRWVATNPPLHELLGVADELGQTDLSILSFDPSRESVLPEFQSLVRSGKRSLQRNIAVTPADGPARVAILQLFPFPVSSSDTFLVLLTDVTGSRPFREVVERSSTCVFILGRRGVEYANPKFIECFGESGTSADLFLRTLMPEDLPAVNEAFKSVLTGDVDEVTVTARMTTASHEVIPVEIRGAATQYEGTHAIIGTVIDITRINEARAEERRLQQAIEHAAREWRMIFDAMETPLIVAHGDGRIERINRAARMIAGASYDGILGRRVSEIASEEPWVVIQNVVARVAATHSPVPVQITDSLGRTWDVLGVPFDVANPADDRVNVVAWDVTQAVELQTQLDNKTTMAAMGTLLGGVAHEVRNPLFAISATLDALEDASAGAHADYFEVLRAEIDRMTTLMQDLLTFGRPSAPDFEESDADTMVDTAIALSQRLARQREVRLVKHIVESELPLIMADRERVTRMLQNVVANAVQHSERGMEVEVEVGPSLPEEGMLEIRVLDHGPGFRDEDIPRVFDPFFSRRKGGTGLGLAIVDQIAGEHRGSVSVKNRTEGGAIITIRLPLASGRAPHDTKRG